LGLGYIAFNAHRPLFRDVRLRQAVSYAIDRRALSRIGGMFGALEQPTDQFLPPTMTGFKDASVYPFTPDLTEARRLTGGLRRTAVLYTCNKSPCDRLAQVVKTNLSAIGIDVVTKSFPTEALFARTVKPGEPFDLAFGDWLADYPDPAGFLDNLASGRTNAPPFDDPAFQRKLRAVSRLSGPRRYLASGTLDVDTARNAAPWVAIGTPSAVDFFSARAGCQVYQPVYGVDLATLCIKP
jgi:peptide/nickel transport system substrate-binding protein